MTEGVRNFLSRLGLDQHYDMFVAKGFDLEGDIPFVNEEDLNSMYITHEGDRKTILEAAPHFKPGREFALYEWLREKGLDHYFIGFLQSELVDLVDISRLNLPDEELYDELEIALPGHKRRLERAVHQLRKKHKTMLPSIVQDLDDKSSDKRLTKSTEGAPVTEIPVTYGRWGKPRCLLDAKYDFLILDATVVSTIDSNDKVDLEFMVDSGSDVVTIRQEVLDTMDLELIGPIRSKGVHASRTKNLYRANLAVGKEIVEIEVMGESYDSIGSRVLRHFRHYISGDKHIWLKGDYCDPTMAPKPFTETTHPVAMPTESVQDTSEKQQEEGIVIADKNIERSPDHKSSPSLDINIEFDLNIQKDYVQIKTNAANTDDNNIKSHVDKIDFAFTQLKKSDADENQENCNGLDETDKMLCDEDEIIDVRPIIESNRKRHANNKTGFDPMHTVNKIKKKDKSSLRDDYKTLRTISTNNNGYESLVTESALETVINQRSVYYRSEGKTIKPEPS